MVAGAGRLDDNIEAREKVLGEGRKTRKKKEKREGDRKKKNEAGGRIKKEMEKLLHD